MVFSSKSVQRNPSYRMDPVTALTVAHCENFSTELSIIRAIGMRGPGSDKEFAFFTAVHVALRHHYYVFC